MEGVLDEAEVPLGFPGKVVEGLDFRLVEERDGLKGFVDGFAMGISLRGSGDIVDQSAIEGIADADLEIVHAHQDIEKGDGQIGHAGDPGGVSQEISPFDNLVKS